MSSYHIWTIGCQMNKADSGRIADYLERAGYAPSPRAEGADIVVLNSCVVRHSAEERVVNKLDALKAPNRGGILALTGCMVEPSADSLARRFPQVDIFFPPQDVSLLARSLEERGLAPKGIDLGSAPSGPGPTALVPIIQGCDNFCTYCIVPYRRGRERSRPLDEVVTEVEALTGGGVREVTLVGQNVDSYGHDLPHKPALADLLAVLDRIEGLSRIRFLTSHPKDMSQGLIQAMARLGKVCEHLSLPLQAGDDDILRAMGRGYTAGQYIELIQRIRQAVPRIALSTDIIVGFPGEREEQFQRTYDLLEEFRFDTVHVACYSPREGTLAARELEDDVPQGEKVCRRQAVEGLQEAVSAEINEGLVGRTVEVLVEGRKKGKWWGRTRTDKLVFFEDEADRKGQLVDIEVERGGPWSLVGRLTGVDVGS